MEHPSPLESTQQDHSRVTLIIISICIAVVLLFYALHYEEVLLNGDGAYVLMQMREILSLSHLDLIHKGYSYCAVIEQLFSAALSFLVSTRFAMIVGYSILFISGYFCIQHLYQKREQPWILGLLMLPLPVPFTQSYAALGGHTHVLLQWLVGALILTHSRFRNSVGTISLRGWVYLGISGGIAINSYRLAFLPLATTVLIAVGMDLLLIQKDPSAVAVKALVKKIAVFLISMFAAALPFLISLYAYANDHSHHASTSFLFEPSHLLQRTERFATVISSLFSPFFEYTITTTGNFNHYTYPPIDVIRKSNLAGTILALTLTGIFLTGLIRSIRQRTEAILHIYILLSLVVYSTVFCLRSLNVPVELESRYMITLYYCLLLGATLSLKEKTRIQLSAFILALALGSHAVILRNTAVWQFQQRQIASCDSLTNTQVFTLLNKLHPPAIAGAYWSVWSAASMMQNSFVFDVQKNKFAHRIDETLEKHPWVYITPHLGHQAQAKTIQTHLQKAGRDKEKYYVTRLGHHALLFEVLKDTEWNNYLTTRKLPPSDSWQELLTILVKQADKNDCNGFYIGA